MFFVFLLLLTLVKWAVTHQEPARLLLWILSTFRLAGLLTPTSSRCTQKLARRNAKAIRAAAEADRRAAVLIIQAVFHVVSLFVFGMCLY